MNDFETIQARWEERCRRQREANAKNAEAIFEALAALGISHVEIGFDGCGDSGQIEDITVTGGDGKLTGNITCAHALSGADHPRTCTLADAVENLCYDLLEEQHGGWQDNDGAFGTFIFDVEKRSVELEFNARYTDYNTSVHTFGEA